MDKKIQYDKIDIFTDNISTFKETSKDSDSASDTVFYMTDSKIEVNFDDVKDQYIKGMKLSKTPCSTDALFVNNEQIYFVEFKNGKISNHEIYSIYNKIYDTLLIFNDITDCNISYCRKNVKFILVYNENKNYKTAINAHFAKKSGSKQPRFNLGQFEKIYFQKVCTYTEKEFEKFLTECTKCFPGCKAYI